MIRTAARATLWPGKGVLLLVAVAGWSRDRGATAPGAR